VIPKYLKHAFPATSIPKWVHSSRQKNHMCNETFDLDTNTHQQFQQQTPIQTNNKARKTKKLTTKQRTARADANATNI
jgi:hypothetical protein